MQAGFNRTVAALGASVVVDLCCAEPGMCRSLNAALIASAAAPVEQYVCASTVWALGANDGDSPTTEDGAHGSPPLGLHGRRPCCFRVADGPDSPLTFSPHPPQSPQAR